MPPTRKPTSAPVRPVEPVSPAAPHRPGSAAAGGEPGPAAGLEDDILARTRAPRTLGADDGDARAPTEGIDVAPRAPAAAAGAAARAGTGPVAGGTKLAHELADAFRSHVRRALGVGLDDSETSLAFVDHYLRTVRSETREPIIALIAAEAGAYYGELVCATIGGTWIGDGRDPRRLRILMRDQFLHFSPVDQALEALLGPRSETDEIGEDPALQIPLDTQFHARQGVAPPADARAIAAAPAVAPRAEAGDGPQAADPAEAEGPDDASWLADRLAEVPPVAESEYYSLTCRFETLKLVLELLATKHVAEGRSPREYDIADYVEALANRPHLH